MRRAEEAAEDDPVPYSGDDAGKLAQEIEVALAQLGLGDPRRLFQHQTFFEGELRLIARALRQMKDKHPTRPSCPLHSRCNQIAAQQRIDATCHKLTSNLAVGIGSFNTRCQPNRSGHLAH